jgi:6-phosphogluconolactonase (cycloisomerase 2 family)
MFAIVGGYTTPDRDGRGNGINVYRIDAGSGVWTHVQNVGGLENPSLFTLNRAGTRLWSVHGGRNLISAFAVDVTTGRLTLLNQQDCGGNNPVDTALDATERHLVVGNYGTGTVVVMPIAEDGQVLPVSQSFTLEGTPGPDPVHQTQSHPHAVIFDPSGRFVVVPDKGFDRTFFFRFDNGRIAPTAQGSIASKRGAAPRHTVFHRTLPILYVNNELDSTVTVFHWNSETGHAAEVQVVTTIPNGHQGRNTTAEIAVSHCGRFLYVSNRGQDSIVLYNIDQRTGHLTYVGHTKTGGLRPRFFALDISGEQIFAANQDSDDITVFRLDPDNGRLTQTATKINVGSPSAISLIAAP